MFVIKRPVVKRPVIKRPVVKRPVRYCLFESMCLFMALQRHCRGGVAPLHELACMCV